MQNIIITYEIHAGEWPFCAWMVARYSRWCFEEVASTKIKLCAGVRILGLRASSQQV